MFDSDGFSGKNPEFDLTEEEKQILAGFNQKQQELTEQKLAYFKSLMRKKGIIAENLKDLRTKDGTKFIEESDKDYASARAFDPTIPYFMQETAFLCHSPYVPRGQDKDNCGWVRGKPNRQSYDDIGPLCGSAGYELFCYICGRLIGRIELIRS